MEVRRKKGHMTMVKMISICADSPEELAAKLKEMAGDGEDLLGLERKPCERSGNESRRPDVGWTGDGIRRPDAGQACCPRRPDDESVLLTIRRDLLKARRRILKGEGGSTALCALDCTIDRLDSLLAEM